MIYIPIMSMYTYEYFSIFKICVYIMLSLATEQFKGEWEGQL
jgi:hypothetical protein